MKLSTGGGKEFEKPAPGTYPARLYRLIDMGTQESTFGGETKYKRRLLVSWELVGTKMQDGRPLTIHKSYTASMHPKATLRADIEAMIGRSLTDDEAENLDLEALIGRACLVGVKHSKCGKYANVSSLSIPMKGQDITEAQNDPVVFFLDEPDWDIYDSLSEGMRAKIALSPEFKAARGDEVPF